LYGVGRNEYSKNVVGTNWALQRFFSYFLYMLRFLNAIRFIIRSYSRKRL